MSEQLGLGPTQRFGFSAAMCIHCGYESDAFTAIGGSGRGPRADDATLCIKCGAIQIVAADGASFRVPTEAELEKLNRDGRVLKMREALKTAEAHGGIKSVSIVKGGAGMTADGIDLTVLLHEACLTHFGLKRGDGKGLNEEQILDIAAAGATLTSAYLADLPYKRRLDVVSGFVDKMLDSFKGKGPQR